MDWWIRRIGQAIVTVWGVLTISFILTRVMPGNAVDAYMLEIADQVQDLQAAREQAQFYMNLDPEAPLHIAYVEYLWATLQGDLGRSIMTGRPVSEVMAEVIPWTLFVMSWAIFLGFFIGVTLGALMAYYEGTKYDIALTGYATVITSIPFYIIALLFLMFLSYRLGWFPSGGRQPEGVTAGFNWPFIKGIMYHAILPVFSLMFAAGFASLTMRGNSIRVLGENYLRVGRLRGLSGKRIAVNYVGRNAILPMYTGVMIAIGNMFGGAVVLEFIFQYRGMGRVMLRAVNMRDHPLMMGAFLVITLAVVVALLLADLTYSKIDPRAKTGDTDAF